MNKSTAVARYPTIAFASCNRQNRPQNFWKEIGSENPSHFLWLGDAVYAKSHSVNHLHIAYQELLSSPGYQKLAKMAYVDGVWDDHDYGVNDAGADADHKEERQSQYLSFLQQSGYKNVPKLIHQDGLYHTLDIPIAKNKSIKVIFLDTRFFRSVHYIRSLGTWKFPYSAIIAAGIRASYSVMGYGRAYAGEILGAEQWKWLEDTLQHSTADLHIIVSSIQVLTSNPVFESWGHFPLEKKRLLHLLEKYRVMNKVVFLSGDVHLAELSQARYHYQTNQSIPVMEITSSGLTHTSSRLICSMMMSLFQTHRTHPAAYSTNKNYGLIQIHPLANQSDTYTVSFTVKAIGSGQSVLTHSLVIPSHPIEGEFVGIEAADFPVLPAPIRALVYVVIAVVMWLMWILVGKTRGRKRVKRQHKRE